jgi:hypothetical protein
MGRLGSKRSSCTALAIASLLGGCAARDAPGEETVGDSETDPSTSAPSTDDDGTTVSPPDDTTTADPGTTTLDPGTTSTGEDTTTGPVELPDCGAIGFVAECEDEDFCTWEPEVGCIVDCTQITDMTQCLSLGHCEWLDDCDFPGPI